MPHMLTKRLRCVIGAFFVLNVAGCFPKKPTNMTTPTNMPTAAVAKCIDDFRRYGRLDALSDALDLLDAAVVPSSLSSIDLEIARAEQLRLFSEVMNSIDTRLDRDYDFTDTPELSVSPSPSLSLPAGVDPQSIRDLVARKEYEAAIVKNQEKAQQFAFQKKLHKINARATEQVEHVIEMDHPRTAEEKLKLNRFVEKSVLHKRRQAELKTVIDRAR